ncbi:MAG: hypothetical protein HXS47_04575 [Theionarchaea archaeon]|nr:hypothetical protein [Theionarchaea archaeon]
MNISVSVPVYPTETREKVKQALENLFPTLQFIDSEEGFSASSQDKKVLDTVKMLLEKQRIRDTARDILIKTTRGNTLTMSLNKQAAYMGKVNFSSQCPLDPIVVSVTSDDIQSVIRYLTGK